MNKLSLAAAIAAICLSGCGGGGGSDGSDASIAPPSPIESTPPKSNPTPPPVTQPTPPTDDTAALAALIHAGGLILLEGRTYHIKSALIATVDNTTLRGMQGTVIDFESPPVGTSRIPGTNDRVFGTPSISTTSQLPIANAINVGDTSFTAANESDVANISPGDWVIITVNDPGIADENTHLGYPTYVDWEQVSSVVGTQVNVVTPFRMAFTNSLPFVTNSSGLGFVRTKPVQNLTIENLTITVEPGAAVVGVYVLGSLNTTLSGVTINDSGSDQIYTEESKGLTITDCNINGGTVLNEFSESVDLLIENSTFKSTNAVPIALDLGMGFFTIKNNVITQSLHVGLYAFYNVHDGTISGNTIDDVTEEGVTASYGMLLLGSPNVHMTDNTLLGGAGDGSVGILAEGFAGATIPELSTGDSTSGNIISGFASTISIH